MIRSTVVAAFIGLASAGNAQTTTGNGCPDDSDTPQIVAVRVGKAHTAFMDSGALPPSCLVKAVASRPRAYPDSTLVLAAALSDGIAKGSAGDPENLSARLVLLPRVGRPAEVPGVFDRMVKLDPIHGSLANYRLVIAATIASGDSAARLRYLSAAARKYPQASSIVAEYEVQRQVRRLRALIDTTHRIMRANPSRIAGYASLASIYGNLDMPDSALAYTRIALSRGVPPTDVAASLQSLVGVTMRKAQLLDARDIWSATLPLARRIDSTLSTNASKHLVALALAELAAYQTESVRNATAGTVDIYGKSSLSPAARASVCATLDRAKTQVDEAMTFLMAGGGRFSPESMSALQSGINQMRRDHAEQSRLCR
jgi:hypothetical protein